MHVNLDMEVAEISVTNTWGNCFYSFKIAYSKYISYWIKIRKTVTGFSCFKQSVVLQMQSASHDSQGGEDKNNIVHQCSGRASAGNNHTCITV